VEDAIKYAEANNVLIVHASGNDNNNNDKGGNFPTNAYSDGISKSTTWLEVGASNHKSDKNLVARFSNYGQTKVDIFAPGVDIYSLAPDNEYKKNSGTSMASPVAAGVAALVWSYYPELSAAQLKEILMKSVVYYGNQKVVIPGESKKKTKFKKLSVSGGIINAYQAMKMADEIVNFR
jgi:subtilisin family serine protease